MIWKSIFQVATGELHVLQAMQNFVAGTNMPELELLEQDVQMWFGEPQVSSKMFTPGTTYLQPNAF